MKAERRHELQHNPTADWLAALFEQVKPYSRAIVGVAVAAAVLLITYVVLSGRAERKRSAAWTDYFQALQAQSSDDVVTDLESVAREHSGVPAGRWAEVALGDLKLGEGVDSLFRDKQAAQTKLKSAVAHYEAALEDAGDPLLAARARYGLGRALESLGRLKEAREAFQAVVDASGTNAYVSLAEARLKDLNRGSTQDFYAWFAKQEPAPLPPADSLPGTPGEKPPFDPSSLSSPGGLDLSGKSLLDLPTLDKETTGPLLTPQTKPGEPDASEKKPVEPGESGKQDESKGAEDNGDTNQGEPAAEKKEETKEQAAQKEDAKDEPAKTEAAKDETGKDAPGNDDKSALKEDSADDKKEPSAGAGPSKAKADGAKESAAGKQ